MTEVCEKLNNFYVNIAKNIDIDAQENISQTHPSVSKIIKTQNTNNQFHFQPVTQTEISMSLNSTYEYLLGKVNLPTLHLARLRTIAIET